MLRAALNRLLSPDPPGPPARDRQDLAIVATINTMAKYLSGRDPFAVLDVSGSALTDSARKLVGEVTSPRLPKRLDQATRRGRHTSVLAPSRRPAARTRTSP